jgi:hypothetical protein
VIPWKTTSRTHTLHLKSLKLLTSGKTRPKAVWNFWALVKENWRWCTFRELPHFLETTK